MNKKDIRNDIDKAVREFFKQTGEYPNLLEISTQNYIKLQVGHDNWTAMFYVPSRGRTKIINKYAGMYVFIKDDINEDYIAVRRVDFDE